jgi:acetyl-CoA synthetase
LREAFEWEVPVNMATYCCDRWADDKGRVALFAADAAGTEATYTFWQLRNITNRLANYLRTQGVERGDRVGVNAPQCPETVIAHIAVWKLGAMSVPLSTLFGPDAIEYRLDDCDAVAAVVDESNLDNVREARESLTELDTTLIVGDASPDAAAGEATLWDAIDDHSREFDPVATVCPHSGAPRCRLDAARERLLSRGRRVPRL